jgi:hypothetical protein
MTGYPYFRISLKRYLKIPMDAKEKIVKSQKEDLKNKKYLDGRGTAP